MMSRKLVWLKYVTVMLVCLMMNVTTFGVIPTTGLTVTDLGLNYSHNAAITPFNLFFSANTQGSSSTSVRNVPRGSLSWKDDEGYYQRNRDLGMVFNPQEGIWLDAVVLQLGSSSKAMLPGAAGSSVVMQIFEVVGIPVLDDKGTTIDGPPVEGHYGSCHAMDDSVEGVEYVQILTATGGTFPNYSSLNNAKLKYQRWSIDDPLFLEGGKRYMFVVGFASPAADRNISLANDNPIASFMCNQDPAYLFTDPAGEQWWGVRREGTSAYPPLLADEDPSGSGYYPTPTSSSDPTITELKDQSMFNDDRLTNPDDDPVSDGFPSVDTYRRLVFYIETSAAPVAPDPATVDYPLDTATGVSSNADISWDAGAYAVSHDVYFGTDPTPDNDGGSSEFIDNRTGTSYDPGTLLLGTTYYWAIDEVNGVGTTSGPVWSFTTNYPVGLENFALLAQYWMDDCGDVDDCIAADWYFDGTINTLDLQQLALSWLGEAIYAFKPISYWNFDEQSGSSAADSIGENHGTLIDFPIDNSQWTDGKVDGALSFDGIDDWVSTAYAGISGAAARTTSAWFKCDGDTGNHQAIFSYGGASGAGNAWRVWLCRDTGAIINAMNGGNANGDTTGLWDGQWHHVAVTFPAGGTHIEDVKIYVDGSEEITWYTNGDTQIVNTAAEDAFEIGMATGGTQFPFEGNIDDVRVYDSELTDAEILALSVMGD